MNIGIHEVNKSSRIQRRIANCEVGAVHVMADYFGIVSGKDTDKFEVSGLTPVRSDLVDAPYVGQFPVVLECRLEGLEHITDIDVILSYIKEALRVLKPGGLFLFQFE